MNLQDLCPNFLGIKKVKNTEEKILVTYDYNQYYVEVVKYAGEDKIYFTFGKFYSSPLISKKVRQEDVTQEIVKAFFLLQKILEQSNDCLQNRALDNQRMIKEIQKTFDKYKVLL